MNRMWGTILGVSFYVSAAVAAPNSMVLMKIVGDLGIQGIHPHHPSSNCQIKEGRHSMANHSVDENGYHETNSKSKNVVWEDLKIIRKMIALALKEKETPIQKFDKPYKPSVRYIAVYLKKIPTEIPGGRRIEFEKQIPVPLYVATTEEKQREGVASTWLIDYIDKHCPNDKPFEEIRAK